MDRDRIILPPLHIKLGLMKQFVKSLDKEGPASDIFVKRFLVLATKKVKAEIFDRPQIRTLIKDEAFILHMTAAESAAWIFLYP